MNRDVVIHQLVAVVAQLRRLEQLANARGSDQRFKERMGPLVAMTLRLARDLKNGLSGGNP